MDGGTGMSVFGLRTVGAVAAVAVATAGVSVGVAVVRAQAATHRTAPAAAADASIVERFDYPGADAIKTADPRVVLVSGDGNIRYDATCATPASGVGQIKVRTQVNTSPICFTVTGGSGWLSMRIEDVYDIDGRKATTASGQTATAKVQPPNEAAQDVPLRTTTTTPIGVQGPDSTIPAVLLDLTVSAS